MSSLFTSTIRDSKSTYIIMEDDILTNYIYRARKVWSNINTLMASNDKYLANIDIKELNRLIKERRLSEKEAKDIKQSRRLVKMCTYNKTQRQKKKTKQELKVEERDSLLVELQTLLQEVGYLKEMKIDLELLTLLDEYEEYEALHDPSL